MSLLYFVFIYLEFPGSYVINDVLTSYTTYQQYDMMSIDSCQ